MNSFLPSLRAVCLALTGLLVGEGAAMAHKPAPVRSRRVSRPPISVTVQAPNGWGLPTVHERGATYVAGEVGERYEIRLTNHTGHRLEAVVTVDGRDVISGGLGDYRQQRGYVLDPYATIVIDGFRQSLQSVAAFRFSSVGESYTGRMGTPQHAGVVGVVTFEEQRHAVARPVRPKPWPGTRPRGRAPAKSSAPGAGASDPGTYDAEAAPPSAPPAADAAAGEASGGSVRRRSAPSSEDSYAPRERFVGPRNELGTEYGETRWSEVQQVPFIRASSRPSFRTSVYYDTLRGLAARGLPVMSPLPEPEPDPWPAAPDMQFAPPPPY